MRSFKLTLNTGIRANLYSVLSGSQSGAGITVAPAVEPTLPAFWYNVIVQNDPLSTGDIRLGGTNISTNGTDGTRIAVGESETIMRGDIRDAIGDRAVVATVDAAIINIDLS